MCLRGQNDVKGSVCRVGSSFWFPKPVTWMWNKWTAKIIWQECFYLQGVYLYNFLFSGTFPLRYRKSASNEASLNIWPAQGDENIYICVLVHDRHPVDQQVDSRLAVKLSFLCWCWLHALDGAMSRDERPKWSCAVDALSMKRLQNGALYTDCLCHHSLTSAELKGF